MQRRYLPVHTFDDGRTVSRDDCLAVEEPLEIRIATTQGRAPETLAVTMRTPGHDLELALGFLLAEGVIRDYRDVRQIGHPQNRDGQVLDNVVDVQLVSDLPIETERLSRHVLTTASCGVCGRLSIDDLTARIPRDPKGEEKLSPAMIGSLPARLRQAQPLFAETGGVHGTALFNPAGDLELVREDVGRHNALDKLVGACLRADRLPAHEGVLLLSGRIGFELVQKALCAGIPTLAAVGAPTSLAVSLATRFQMTLIGFLKAGHFNVYCGLDRLEEPGCRR